MPTEVGSASRLADRVRSRLSAALDAMVLGFPTWDRLVYAAFAFACVLYAAASFYGYLRLQTRGAWSAPLDDVFIHFDYARATARGFPFQWSEGNGFSSGNTSLTYPFALAFGYLVGFRGMSLMLWAAVLACISTFAFLLAAGSLLTPLGRWAKYLVPPAVLSLGALDWSLFSGMENAFHLGVWALVLALTLWTCRAAERGQPTVICAWLTGLAGALLYATRPESVICVASFAGFAGLVVLRAATDRGTALPNARRAALATVLRIGVPGAIVFALQIVANHAFTGEWSANGAIAKLTINNPYMTPLEKFWEYKFLLGYVIVRNTQHHFADVTPWGWIVPILATAPLMVPKVRPIAILLWIQALGWLALVAMNAQVRWQNERYTMAAVAWILVLAAMGLACLASELGKTRREHLIWGARTAVAIAIVVLYWIHQAPNMRDQIWFFGRASRNIRDQQIVAGRILSKLETTRVLVGDAGALMYASDRPGLDLIGLGGYHDFPFARAGVHGLAASLELIERMPELDRPDTMAIYPSWWGDLPSIFGQRIISVVVTGNVICGDSEKVIYRADWSTLDRTGLPRGLARGERVADELDVADLVNERAHGYVYPHPSMGFTSFRVLPDPLDSRRDLFDGGREIPGGEHESARLRVPRGHVRLVTRAAAGPRAFRVAVTANGHAVGDLQIPRGAGWREVSLDLPNDLGGETEITLTPVDEGWTSFHVWIVDANGRATIAGPSPP